MDQGISSSAWEGYDTGNYLDTRYALNLIAMFWENLTAIIFCFRTRPLSLRGSETGLKDMTGILRTMS